MNNFPKVSVLMCTYNPSLLYFEEAVRSVLNQTYKNFEFIIVNDGSTVEVASAVRSFDDPRIVFMDNIENKGLTACLNEGLAKCTGDFIARMDDDDICLENRLERQVMFFMENEMANVVGSDVEVFGQESRVSHYILEESRNKQQVNLFFGNIGLAHPSVMLRRSFLDKYRIKYNESFIKGQDYGLWVDCVQYDRLYCIPEVLLKYRVHKQQASQKDKDKQKLAQKLIRREQLMRLYIEPTEEDMELHLVLCGNGIAGDYKHLDCMGKWIRRIESANRKTRYLDNSFFKQELGKRFVVSVLSAMKSHVVYGALLFKHIRIVSWCLAK